MSTCGVSSFPSFSVIISFARSNVADDLKFNDEEPTFTVYFPASAIHDERFVSKDARSAALIVNVNVCDSPGFNDRVFTKPFSSSDGLSNFFDGALMYNSATSFPATLPLLVIVTVAMVLFKKFVELSLRLP
jgi:hypothetical protein